MADEAAKTDSGKTVVIAIDGSEQARNAFDCKLSIVILTRVARRLFRFDVRLCR